MKGKRKKLIARGRKIAGEEGKGDEETVRKKRIMDTRERERERERERSLENEGKLKGERKTGDNRKTEENEILLEH